MVKYLGISKKVKHIKIYHIPKLRKDREVNKPAGRALDFFLSGKNKVEC